MKVKKISFISTNLNYLNFYFGNLLQIVGLLGYLGAMPAEEPYVSLALICSINYFGYFLLITNLDYLYKYIVR